MSELKVYRDPQEGPCWREFYLKSEADQVISELQSDIADLRDDKKSTDDILDERNAEIAELKAIIEERDKVIAEKDKEIMELKERFFGLQYTTIKIDKKLTETRQRLRHSNHKRCLANANYWVAISYHCVDDKHRKKAEKRHYKWLELAEKFKEAKL